MVSVVATQGRLKNMASGEVVGEFSFKVVTITNSPGPAGSVLIQVNWEGTATGFGAVFNTATFVGGPKNGTSVSVGLHTWTMATVSAASGRGPMRVLGNTDGARKALCSSPMAAGSAARVRSTWPRALGRERYPR